MSTPLIEVPLHSVAHARAGDKGNRLNISLVPYEAELWPWLQEQVTEDFVLFGFADRAPSQVKRYLLPHLHAMNFVLDDVLEGGVNRALTLDRHGKTLSFLLLSLPVRVPEQLVRR